MKNIFLRSKYNIKYINWYVFLALLPLILAGFYKNGITLYQLHLTGLYGLLKPLIFDVLGLLIGIIVNIIYEKVIKKNNDKLNNIISSSFHPLYGLLIASIISINTNIFLFIIITFLVLFISKFYNSSKINLIALSALIIILIINLFGDFTFLNSYEINNHLNLTSLDYFLGKGSGGINTTHVIFLIISLLILCSNKCYKKEIPLYTSLIYLLCIIIYGFIINNVGDILDNMFSNGILFSFIFIATEPLSSPITNKGKLYYSIIVALTSFGLFLIYPPLSALGGIIIGSLCHQTLDNLAEK